ncbi:MAG: putative polysaccharide biosynthesis protein [Natronincolaceae bacterium]|jgi:stage V sporulation protein B|nr:polysaccharide biosynthesis protein [Bacillota bacterium]NLK90710.1 polysaccharide biosynthesis protein [Clostridiales bacterium]
MKKDTFLKGAFILGISGIIVKIVGAFFRIPLANIIGSEGVGYYQVAYPIYTFLLSFSAAGFPTAISKLVSEKRARGNIRGGHKVFQVSLGILMIIGVVSFLFLSLGARFLVDTFIKGPNSYFSILALAPALLFIPVMAAYRGYFQGLQNMIPTAVSQVVEQIARVIAGLALATFLLSYGTEYAAAGASFGATAGAIAGLIVIFLIYINNKNAIFSEFQSIEQYREEPPGRIAKDLLRIAVPITVGAAVLPLINMIDSMIVLRRLQEAIGLSYFEANSLFGQLTGMAITLVQLPPVLTTALSMSIVPVIAASKVREDTVSIERDIKSAFRVTLLIGLPSFVGLAVLSTPIMTMLFPKEPASAGKVLLYLSFATLSLASVQTLTGILQGIGKPEIPVRNLLFGALTKLIVTYILTGVPFLNIKGAAIGTVMAYVVAAALDLVAVKKNTKVKFEFIQFVLKPTISVGIMGGAVYLIHRSALSLTGNTISTIGSIIIGGIVYGLMLLITGTILEEDFLILPGGDRLAAFLHRLGLLKQ